MGSRHNEHVTGFPLLLDLTGRRVLVVGGGVVASRRVGPLVEAGADVLVVSPVVDEVIRALDVHCLERPFQDSDVDGAWLALACTDSAVVNAAVAAAAQQRQIFCVRADQAVSGTARVPAVLERYGLTVS